MRSASYALGLVDPFHAFNDILDHNAPDGSVALADIGHLFVIDVHEWAGLTVVVQNPAGAAGNLTCDLRGFAGQMLWTDINGGLAEPATSLAAFSTPSGPNHIPVFDRGSAQSTPWVPVGGALVLAAGAQGVLDMHPSRTPWLPYVMMRVKFAVAGAGNAVSSQLAVYDRLPDNGSANH